MTDPDLRREGAREANASGMALADQGRYAEAIAHYERAIELQPERYAAYANLGIACKHLGDFPRSLSASLRALELDPEAAGSGVLWNVGIAATALADWPRAREAWSKVGIKVPPGEGPLDMDIGATPIRIGPGPSGAKNEVVWCHRIDPARARIESIPTPESGRHFGDLLLHDGEPTGKRRLGEHEVSVFDELAVLEPSRYRTFVLDVVAPRAEDLDALYRAFADAPHAALEDFTGSLQVLCSACSRGLPHDHHDDPKSTPWSPTRRVALATLDPGVFALLACWVSEGAGRAASPPLPM